MTVESAAYISGLVPAYPPGSDSISEGDDHLRLLKTVLQGTFPNANAAINGIHTGTSAPSAKTAGTIWYDTTTSHKVLKIYDGSGWVTLVSSPATDFKLLGATNVGWVLPTSDGSADQFLTTDGSGNLDWASAAGAELPSQTGNSGKFLTTNGSAASWAATTGSLIGITQAIQTSSTYMRNDSSYATTGYSVTHNKTSATSDLYVMLDTFINSSNNFENTSTWSADLRLAKGASPDSGSVGDLVAGTTDNIQCALQEDVGQGTGVTWDFSTGFSRCFKVTAANCPHGTTGSNEFQVWAKITADGDDGGLTFTNGTMAVMEIE